METLIDIGQGILAFSIVIAIAVGWHEFGHFIVAKLSGVKVLEFAIGMGKTVYQRKGKDGVTYKICALPIGGYVRMLNDADYHGEEKHNFRDEDRAKTFEAAGILKKSLIVAAGPFFNLILAIGLFTYLGYNYTYYITPQVGYVSENISLDKESERIEVGDVIVKVNNEPVESTSDFFMETITSVGEVVELEMSSGKKVTINLSESSINNKNTDHQLLMGFSFSSNTRTNEIKEVFPDTPAEKFGLKKGDIIESIDGRKTPNFYEIQRAILELEDGDNSTFKIKRGAQDLELVILPRYEGNNLDDKKAKFGFSPKSGSFDMSLVKYEDRSFVDAVKHGVDASFKAADITISSIYKIFSGDISPKMLGGAVTIGHSAKVSIESGMLTFLTFMGFFNINLMVMNLIPIPPLDGGHLAKFGIEAIIRREIKEKYVDIVQKLGICAIGSLMLWGFFADYLRFVK